MDWITKSDGEILDFATPIMDSLMQAANESDYERHVRDFCPEAKEALSKESFENQCKMYQVSWGHFTERELLGTVKKSSSVWVLWRQWCAKSEDQYIASLCLFEKDGRIQISEVGVT